MVAQPGPSQVGSPRPGDMNIQDESVLGSAKNRNFSDENSQFGAKNELLLSFEERIFEKQLKDCKKLCSEYIDIYEDKEYW